MSQKMEEKPERLIKSKRRVKKFGEVFTPEHIVKQMCDLCEPNISRIDGKVFEPTCGNGNFLVEILRRKLAKIKFRTQEQFEFDIILALSNICAVDIQTDNVVEARERLRDVVFQFIREQKEEKARKNTIHFLDAIEFVLERTILVGNTLTQKAKLTFYDFKPDRKELVFEISSHSLKDIEETYQKTKKATVKNLCQMVNEFESLTEKSRKVHKKLQKQSPKPESTPDQLQISLLEGES